MTIDGPNTPLTPPGAIRLTRDAPVAPVQAPATRPADPRASPRDSVSISDDARRLNAEAVESDGLTEARAAQVRERLLTGAYHSVEMAGLVAERILRSGDV